MKLFQLKPAIYSLCTIAVLALLFLPFAKGGMCGPANFSGAVCLLAFIPAYILCEKMQVDSMVVVCLITVLLWFFVFYILWLAGIALRRKIFSRSRTS